MSDVVDFYDGLAGSYELVYGGRWDEAVERHGGALDSLLRETVRDGGLDVLDCSCGIGTQAIGLALRGHRVVGSDISTASLRRAREEARRLGAPVSFVPADFRDLSGVAGDFDVVLSCDNALPHLLDDADVRDALRAMRAKLRADGLLLIGIRDYDAALVARARTAPPIIVDGPPRRLFVRLHEWDGDDSLLHTVRFLVLTEQASGWSIDEHATRYRALTRDALAALAADAGFSAQQWTEVDGYHQPLFLARAG